MEIIYDLDSVCKGKGIFNMTYSPDAILTMQQIAQVAANVFGYGIVFVSPINVAANIFSAMILLTKELRNPFNVVLSIMCIECALPLAIKASLIYRLMTVVDCNANTLTYSLAMHGVIVFDSWLPFRAAYTWMTAFLTAIRYRALHSKGKWEASYSLVFAGSMVISLISAGAGIPLYMVNIVAMVPIEQACGRPSLPSEQGVLVFHGGMSPTYYDNNCLLFNINQIVSGILHNTLPSLLLLLFTIMLAFELGKARQNHNAIAKQSSKKTDDAEKAARMLTIVAIFTLLSELPQGVMCLLYILFPLGFQTYYGDSLMQLWITIQLITTSCNLLIYLAMSRNFRKAVFTMFCGRCRKEKIASPQASVISVSTVVNIKQNRF